MTTPPSAPTPTQLVDCFGRRLHYLRLSITDLCNLRCRYCMPPEGVEKLPQDMVLTLEELARVARIAVGLGVDKIRLTGGEPLLRKGLPRLLADLKALRPRPDLRMTTNGILLAAKHPQQLDKLLTICAGYLKNPYVRRRYLSKEPSNTIEREVVGHHRLLTNLVERYHQVLQQR